MNPVSPCTARFLIRSPHSLLALAILLMPPTLRAIESAHTHPHHHHNAHVHGEAELLLTLEGERLLIVFHSPAFNLLGFEHPPRTPTQQVAISRVERQLNAHDRRYALMGGDCTLIHKQVGLPYSDKPEHGGEAPPGDHSEFEASYQYRCTRSEKLVGIETDLFSLFPGIRKIHVSWVFPHGQGATVLTPEESKLEIN